MAYISTENLEDFLYYARVPVDEAVARVFEQLQESRGTERNETRWPGENRVYDVTYGVERYPDDTIAAAYSLASPKQLFVNFNDPRTQAQHDVVSTLIDMANDLSARGTHPTTFAGDDDALAFKRFFASQRDVPVFANRRDVPIDFIRIDDDRSVGYYNNPRWGVAYLEIRNPDGSYTYDYPPEFTAVAAQAERFAGNYRTLLTEASSVPLPAGYYTLSDEQIRTIDRTTDDIFSSGGTFLNVKSDENTTVINDVSGEIVYWVNRENGTVYLNDDVRQQLPDDVRAILANARPLMHAVTINLHEFQALRNMLQNRRWWGSDSQGRLGLQEDTTRPGNYMLLRGTEGVGDITRQGENYILQYSPDLGATMDRFIRDARVRGGADVPVRVPDADASTPISDSHTPATPNQTQGAIGALLTAGTVGAYALTNRNSGADPEKERSVFAKVFTTSAIVLGAGLLLDAVTGGHARKAVFHR